MEAQEVPLVPVVPFSPTDWLARVVSDVGISMQDVPGEVVDKVALCSTKNEVNMLFFMWFNSRVTKKLEFSKEDLEGFTNYISAKDTAAYKRVLGNFTASVSYVEHYQKEVRRALEKMTEARLELLAFGDKIEVDIPAEIQKAVADGWYTYHGTMHANKLIEFITPRVFTKFYNKEAGIDMDVDMGRFLVRIESAKGNIMVLRHEDNLDVEGYWHPHIGGKGDVCWGNAEKVFTKDMEQFTFSKSLEALRVILTNYNDASPFRDLMEFALQRNPNLMAGRAEVYAKSTVSYWMREYDEPRGIEQARDSRDGEDGNREYLYRAYMKVYEGTMLRVPGTDLYFRTKRDDVDVYVNVDDYCTVEEEND